MSRDMEWDNTLWDNAFAGLEALGERAEHEWPQPPAAERRNEPETDSDLDTGDLQLLGELELLSYPPRLA